MTLLPPGQDDLGQEPEVKGSLLMGRMKSQGVGQVLAAQSPEGGYEQVGWENGFQNQRMILTTLPPPGHDDEGQEPEVKGSL